MVIEAEKKPKILDFFQLAKKKQKFVFFCFFKPNLAKRNTVSKSCCVGCTESDVEQHNET